jgi:hypothetical protein
VAGPTRSKSSTAAVRLGVGWLHMDAVGMRLGRELAPASYWAHLAEINAVQASIR